MDPRQIGLVLEAETKQCVAELYLNGVPIALCGIGVQDRIAHPVNQFILDGRNELSVLINPGDTPATSLEPSTVEEPARGAQLPPDPLMDAYRGDGDDEDEADATDATAPGGDRRWTDLDVNDDVTGIPARPGMLCSARLMRYAVGATARDGSGECLVEVDWNAHDLFEDLRKEEQPFPRVARAEADLGACFGGRTWTTTRKLKLDEATIEEIRGILDTIRESLERGEAEPALAMSVDRFQEVGRAYAINPGERAAAFRKMIADQSRRDSWLFETPSEQDYSLRLCAGGRLVECIARDWKPLIRTVNDPDSGQFFYPVLLGRSNRDWRILL